jgi:hypothetical protein
LNLENAASTKREAWMRKSKLSESQIVAILKEAKLA